jgi:hypothetical protein
MLRKLITGVAVLAGATVLALPASASTPEVPAGDVGVMSTYMGAYSSRAQCEREGAIGVREDWWWDYDCVWDGNKGGKHHLWVN